MNGTQGPTGPQGIQGIQGPIGPNGTQGLPGPNQILNTSIYTEEGNLSFTTGDGMALSIAMCDPGDTVLSGNYAIIFPGNATQIVDRAVSTHNGWETSALGPRDQGGAVAITSLGSMLRQSTSAYTLNFHYYFFYFLLLTDTYSKYWNNY